MLNKEFASYEFHKEMKLQALNVIKTRRTILIFKFTLAIKQTIYRTRYMFALLKFKKLAFT